VKADSYAFILTYYSHRKKRFSAFISHVISSFGKKKRSSRFYLNVKTFFTAKKTFSRTALHGERGMKEREAGRAEKKRLWHSFLYADVTYWIIDPSRSGFWQGATARLISKLHALSPPRLGFLFLSKKGEEASGD